MSRAPRALRRPGRHLGRPGIPASELRSARPARPATPARVGSAATRSGPRPGADDRRRRADREFRLAADHGEGEIDLGRCVCEGPAARLAATGDALPAPPRGHPSYARVDACRVGASPVRTRRAWRSAARSSPTASTAARGGSQRFDAFAPSDESDRCGDAVHPLRLPPPTSEAPSHPHITGAEYVTGGRRSEHRRRGPMHDRRGSCPRGLPAITDRLSAGSPATPTVTLRGHA